MRISFFSAQPWAVASESPAFQEHRISKTVAGLDALADHIRSARPDLVFMGGFEQSPQLLEVLRQAAAASPGTILIPVISSPTPEFLLQAMRYGVREVLPSDSAEEVQQALARISKDTAQQTSHAQDENPTSHRIGFISAKGGDGGSCISANFSATLAQSSQTRVMLVDMAIPFGDVEMYVTPASAANDLADIATEIERLDQSLLGSLAHRISDNFDLLASPRSLEKVINMQPSHLARTFDLAAEHYHYVVFDIGTRFDPLSIQALEGLDRLFIVVTQSIASIRRADRILQLLEMLGFSANKVSIIVNKFSAKEPVGISEIENALHQTVFCKVGSDADGLRESMIKGAAYVGLAPKSDFSKSMSSLAKDWHGAPKEEKSVWRRFGIR